MYGVYVVASALGAGHHLYAAVPEERLAVDLVRTLQTNVDDGEFFFLGKSCLMSEFEIWLIEITEIARIS